MYLSIDCNKFKAPNICLRIEHHCNYEVITLKTKVPINKNLLLDELFSEESSHCQILSNYKT